MTERTVLVTTAHRGVFFGYTTLNDADLDAEETIRLTRARNCIYWPFCNRGFLGNDLAHKTAQRCAVNAIDDTGHDLTFAADRADDRLLTGTEATAPLLRAVRTGKLRYANGGLSDCSRTTGG